RHAPALRGAASRSDDQEPDDGSDGHPPQSARRWSKHPVRPYHSPNSSNVLGRRLVTRRPFQGENPQEIRGKRAYTRGASAKLPCSFYNVNRELLAPQPDAHAAIVSPQAPRHGSRP